MFKSLSYQIKNRLLLAATLVLALLSWNFAFHKTVDAITLNTDLNQKLEQKSDLSVNPDYLNRKSQAVTKLLKQYTLDSAGWRNDFWLKVSHAASLKQADIAYNPKKILLTDSLGLRGEQEIVFTANYKSLVLLLDTLERMKGVGFIGSSRFQIEQDIAKKSPEQVSLNLRVSMLTAQVMKD